MKHTITYNYNPGSPEEAEAIRKLIEEDNGATCPEALQNIGMDFNKEEPSTGHWIYTGAVKVEEWPIEEPKTEDAEFTIIEPAQLPAPQTPKE